jgi:hypothetical protein
VGSEYGQYECPKLDWYALQVGLERTESDVLILLDACCSAGASNLSSGYDSNQGGRTEIIAACGFDEVTNGESFTRVLIGELKHMAKDDCNFDQQISALQLHGRMLESMRYQNLPESDDPGIFLKSDHRFSTPVYMSLTRDHSQPSILLKRFRPQVVRSRGSSIRSIGSSINNGPRQRPQIKPHEVEDIADPTSADHPKSPNPAPDSAAPAREPTWGGVPYAPSLLETPEEPEPADLELLLIKER